MLSCLKRVYKRIRFVVPSATVLMLHHVTDAPEHKRSILMSTDRFKELIDSFDVFVSLSQALKIKAQKRLAVTFDDGLEDVFDIAYPLLRKRNVPFTVFIAPDLLDTEGYITTEQLKKMAEDPLVTIGSHCLSHVPIKGLPKEKQRKELFESKAMLERILNVPVNYLAYPYGQIDRQGIKLLQDNKGYDYAFIASGGPLGRTPKNRFKTPRLRVDDKKFDETMQILRSVYGVK